VKNIISQVYTDNKRDEPQNHNANISFYLKGDSNDDDFVENLSLEVTSNRTQNSSLSLGRNDTVTFTHSLSYASNRGSVWKLEVLADFSKRTRVDKKFILLFGNQNCTNIVSMSMYRGKHPNQLSIEGTSNIKMCQSFLSGALVDNYLGCLSSIPAEEYRADLRTIAGLDGLDQGVWKRNKKSLSRNQRKEYLENYPMYLANCRSMSLINNGEGDWGSIKNDINCDNDGGYADDYSNLDNRIFNSSKFEEEDPTVTNNANVPRRYCVKQDSGQQKNYKPQGTALCSAKYISDEIDSSLYAVQPPVAERTEAIVVMLKVEKKLSTLQCKHTSDDQSKKSTCLIQGELDKYYLCKKDCQHVNVSDGIDSNECEILDFTSGGGN
jgi:hypothetical protein